MLTLQSLKNDNANFDKLAIEMFNPTHKTKTDMLVACGFSRAFIAANGAENIIKQAQKSDAYRFEAKKRREKCALTIAELQGRLMEIADTAGRDADRLTALKLLGQTIGAFTDKVELNGSMAGFADMISERRRLLSGDVIEAEVVN